MFHYVAVDGGLRALMRCIKEGYKFGAILIGARLVGMAVGALGATTAARWPRFGGRRRSPSWGRLS